MSAHPEDLAEHLGLDSAAFEVDIAEFVELKMLVSELREKVDSQHMCDIISEAVYRASMIVGRNKEARA